MKEDWMDKIELNTRKSVHIAMPTTIHRAFKTEVTMRGLSMQEVFEEMATRVAEGNDQMITLLEEIRYAKKTGTKLRRRLNNDEQELYDLLEENDPFS